MGVQVVINKQSAIEFHHVGWVSRHKYIILGLDDTLRDGDFIINMTGLGHRYTGVLNKIPRRLIGKKVPKTMENSHAQYVRLTNG